MIQASATRPTGRDFAAFAGHPADMPPPPVNRTLARRLSRQGQLFGGGFLLFVLPWFVWPLPFPAATLSSIAGLALILKNSAWAKRRYVGWKRRNPKTGRVVDKGLRRRSRQPREQADEALDGA
jgi:hypothetical protein